MDVNNKTFIRVKIRKFVVAQSAAIYMENGIGKMEDVFG
jgi:hypothetical protein